jgi:replication-associated recombination protein RarA
MFGRSYRKRKMIGIAIALIGLGALSACHSRTPEARVDHVASKVANKLDLNAQQKVLLDDIANEIKKDMQAEKDIRLSMHSELKAMIASEELDKTKVKSAIKAKMERIDGKVDKYLDKVAALHKSLNAEQRQELLALVEKFEPRH